MANPEEKKEVTPITPRSGRVGNFLVNEEVIVCDDAEPLSRLHISDTEHGWEVVIPQTYASAYNIVSMVFDEGKTEDTENVLHWLFDNFFLVTTCLDGQFHSLLRDIAVIGFTPATDKKQVKIRKSERKKINERLRAFEFPMLRQDVTEDEERQEEIFNEAKDILHIE